MASFNVESLFIIVPLDDTMYIILEQIFIQVISQTSVNNMDIFNYYSKFRYFCNSQFHFDNWTGYIQMSSIQDTI